MSKCIQEYMDYIHAIGREALAKHHSDLMRAEKPIAPSGEPESVKEIYWRLRAERLERELAARTSAPAYFWLGREAEAA